MTSAAVTPSGVIIDLSGTLGLKKGLTKNFKHRDTQLFHLPVMLTGAAVDGDEESLLLDERKRRPSKFMQQCDVVGRVSWAICPLLSTLLIAAILAVVVVVFQRLDKGIKTIDSTVDLTSTASSMLQNMNGILKSGASLVNSADKLGLKALNLTYVLGPFAGRVMNRTEHLLEQVDSLTSHPTISLG